MADIFEIENCPLDYYCSKTWDELVDTKDKNIKFCKECSKDVKYCETIEEFDEMAKIGHCVAYRVYQHGENDGKIWEVTLGLPLRKKEEQVEVNLEKFLPQPKIHPQSITQKYWGIIKKILNKK